MNADQIVEAVVDELQRRIKASGWGGVGKITRGLKINRNYFSRWKEASQVRLLPLTQALEYLAISPPEFFVRALKTKARCGPNTAELAAQLLDSAETSPRLERAIENLYAALAAVDQKCSAEVGHSDESEGFGLRFTQLWAKRGQSKLSKHGRDWLLRLDELRYTKPDAVVKDIDQNLEELEPEEVPFALGVLGSTLRMKFDYERAERYLRQGLEFADEVLDHSVAGALHQRLSMVSSDRGSYEAAFSQNCFALGRFLDGEDFLGIARSMVSRGIILGLWGHYSWSTGAFRNALEKLPDSESRGRASALLGICRNFVEQGEIHRAIPYAIDAEELPVGPLGSGKSSWNSGAIFARAGNYSKAFIKLRQAQETLRDLAPVDAALVTIDMCEVLLLAGRPFEAYREAEAMLEFIEPLRERTPLAEAAAYELAAAGARGEGLSFAILHAARAKVNARPN